MALYQREKINPLAGCLPMLIQLPIFLALLRVLYLAIDMRQAPFLWLSDLSARDPSSIWTLFGLIPWNPAAVPVHQVRRSTAVAAPPASSPSSTARSCWLQQMMSRRGYRARHEGRRTRDRES